MELLLCSIERFVSVVRVDEQLDFRPHRPEVPGFQEVLVTVRGGRFTTRTDGPAAGAAAS